MIERLSPAGRRALAFGLLAAAVLLVLGLAVGPPLMVHLYRSDLAATEQRIATLQRRAPARERLVEEEKALAESSPEHMLLRGSSPGVAAAQLQGDLTALASAMGASVASAQILDPQPATPFIDVGLRLTMNADISTLRDFLYAVEVRDPVLTVRSLNLSRSEGGAQGEVPPGMETLSATLEIHGYLPAPIPGPAAGQGGGQQRAGT